MDNNKVLVEVEHSFGVAKLYSDRVLIKNKVGFFTLLTDSVAEKIIYFDQINAVHIFPKTTWAHAHIKFDLKLSSNLNTVHENVAEIVFKNQEEEMNKFYENILQVMEKYKKSKNTDATDSITSIDKIKKLKELLDLNIITQEEFNSKKEKLMQEI